MSVLVSGIAIVVPRRVLDLHWPGGTDGLLDVASGAPGAIGACADARLASVSFADSDALEPVAEALRERGLVELADDRFVDFAIVAEDVGPILPCAWLEWRRDARGFTYAWETATEPGDMAVPAGWTLPGRRREARGEEIETAEGRLQLAVENGMETWLDLATGQLHQRPSRRDASPVESHDADDAPAFAAEHAAGDDEGPPAGPLRAAVEEMVAEVGWHVKWVPAGAFIPRVNGKAALYDVLIGVDDEYELLTVRLVLPIHVPAERRTEVAVLLNRLNYERVLIGAFEQDVSDGEVRWRTGMDVEGAVTVGAILRNTMSAAFTFVDLHFAAIVGVAFAGKSVEEAMGELS